MSSVTYEIPQVLDLVRHDPPTHSTVSDGLEALRLRLAAKKSVAEHRPVKLAEIEG